MENPVEDSVVNNGREQMFPIYCMRCRAHTARLKEITLKRKIGNQYYAIGKCVHCGTGKSKQLNQDQRMKLSHELLNIPTKSLITMHLISGGKALPLASLIPVLIGDNVMGRGLEPTVQEESPLPMGELLTDAGYSRMDVIKNSINLLEENGYEITLKGRN